jgi:hypothetical protein
MNTIIKKFAGKLSIISCFVLIMLLAVSCKEDQIGQPPVDGRRPDPVKDVTAIGRAGGAYIFYKLPDNDTDISYVRGEFEINGEKQIVRSSVYNNYLAIEGLESHLYVDINLYVVDHSENVSEPVSTRFITFDAPYTTMGNSIKLTSSIGGIAVRWETPDSDVQYYANMGYLSSDYSSDIGVVILVADDRGKMNELAVSFSPTGALLQPVTDTVARLYGAYAMDKWGHYSDTVFAMLKPVYERWLDRRLMKAYYIGDDNRELEEPNPNHRFGYYSFMGKLFDSIAYCLQPTDNVASSNFFSTGQKITVDGVEIQGINPATGQRWIMPFYFTMDLGIEADVSRFWIAPKTHSRNDRFWEYSNGAIYDFELWGTTTDFGENSLDYMKPDDPYWTDPNNDPYWKTDPRWKHMGRYLNKRHNVPADTPGNLSSDPPYDPSSTELLDRDPAWTESRRIREMGNGYRYLADGSGPVKNNGFYSPDAGWHFAINKPAVGPVRYIRWQINETWGQQTRVQFQELWYWGGIIE